jgi:hypothetical protein
MRLKDLYPLYYLVSYNIIFFSVLLKMTLKSREDSHFNKCFYEEPIYEAAI